MKPLITIIYSDEISGSIIPVLKESLKSEGFKAELIKAESLIETPPSRTPPFAGVFVFTRFDKEKDPTTLESLKNYLENSKSKGSRIIAIGLRLDEDIEEILRMGIGIDKVVEPEEWKPIPIAMRVLSAIYGGFGKFDKNELVRMDDEVSHGKLYLDYKTEKTYAQYKTNQKGDVIEIKDGETIAKTHTIIGPSKRMRDLFREIKELGQSTQKEDEPDNPVLIRGETGTGKEMVAEAIHFGNEKNKSRYSSLNITGLPVQLLENELFGHEKGAFSEAKDNRIGLLIEVGGGTIFLDEIGELSMETQTKLLRVLENREIRMLGSTKIFRFKARLITATHENLEKMISKGLYRNDFYQRIKGKVIVIPNLRDRKSEFELLAKEIHDKWNTRQRKENKLYLTQKCFDKIVDCCIKYSFNGNIRALKRNLENSFKIWETKKSFNIQDLKIELDYDLKNELDMDDKSVNPPAISQQIENHITPLNIYSIIIKVAEDETLKNFIERAKKMMVNRVYKDCGKDPIKAQERLRISKGTFYKYKYIEEAKTEQKKKPDNEIID